MILVYQGVQILYWLILAVWLGGMVFIVVAAPTVFRVARRIEARSGRYGDPRLDEDQPTIVAGEVVNGLLARMGQVQMICATGLLPLMLLQMLLIDLGGNNLIAALIRFGLWLALVVLMMFEWRSHYPKTWQLRQKYLNAGDDEEGAAAAREAFDREHRKSEQMFFAGICLLAGLLMLSANIQPRTRTSVTPVVPAIEP